jgi:AcrR family transcriptional regulator
MKFAETSIPPRKRRPQAERSESMQRCLLDAATVVLKERGLAGFRTAEVIKRAGVSKGALLHHFPTKVSLIAAAFDRLRAATDASDRPPPQRPTLIEAISDLVTESHAFFFGDAHYVGLDIAISGARMPDLRDAIFNSVRGVRQQAEELWIERLAAYGLSHEQAHDAVWLANSILRGLATKAIYERDHVWFPRLERIAVVMIAKHFSKPDGDLAAD